MLDLVDDLYQQGLKLHGSGKVELAYQVYTLVLNAHPEHSMANHSLGVLSVDIGKVQEALPFFEAALQANADVAQFWVSYIDALINVERIADAHAVFGQAKSNGAKGEGFDKLERRLTDAPGEPLTANSTGLEEKQPKHPNILDGLKLDQALSLARKKARGGDTGEAKRIYQDILAKFPKNKRARDSLKGLSSGPVRKESEVQDPPHEQLQSLIKLFRQGQLQQALQLGGSLIQSFPQSAILFNVQGSVFKDLGQLDHSIKAYNKALAIKPDYADAYYNIGNALKDQGKMEEAIEAYNKTLAIKPDYAEAYINMGNALKGQGKLEEAIEAYNKALAIKPDYANACYNIGVTFQEQSKLKEAAEAYNKALAIKPDYAEACYNMGVTLQEQRKLEEAIVSYNKALDIKPDYAEAYNNKGNAFKDQGMLEEAIEVFNKALAIKPDYAEAYYNIGVTLHEQGKLEEEIEAYNKALAIKPDYAEACYNMGNALKGIVFMQPNPGLQKTITSLLDLKSFVRPRDIARAALSLLKFEPKLNRHLQTSSVAEPEPRLREVITDLSELPLLLKLMSVCPLPDLVLENLFRSLRANLLSSISDLTGPTEELKFQSALALQCFTNEYVYNQSEHEDEALAVLEVAVKEVLKKGEQPSPQSILCLASYRSLNLYEWSSSLHITNEIEDVFTRQVLEPNQEAQFKTVLPVLGDITDEVSTKVRDQYEESPYPRWVNLGMGLKPAPISKAVEEINLKLFDDKIKEVELPNILIAGCGTGQHSIGTAARFKNSKVLAIDLSLSSLSYAKRKTEELDIQNIDYMQADILDLGKLGRQFDIVESSGVLHHMDDPLVGWRVLTDCLKPGGLMKIGLYSELARQHIVEMRQEISKAGIGSSDAAMKSFRTTVMTSDQSHHKKILNFSDFFSLSELKDLLFHVQERRFTIPQIQDSLSELGLKFCGFEADKNSHFKRTNTGADDPYDLGKWQAYEEANPNAFAGMYQFWCQKLI